MTQEALSRILFVEDDPDIQRIAELVLQSIGKFTVRTCSCGKEAIQEASRFQPQLILMDMMMPDMDGLETLKMMREKDELKKIPVIFMTAKVQTSEIDHYKKMGALDVIRKPFEPMQLCQTIQNIWKNR